MTQQNPESMKCRIILSAKCCLRLTPLVFLLFSWMKAQIDLISQLFVYVRYVADERINEEFLFRPPLETTSKAVDVFQMLIDFFDKTELSWSKLVGVCTDVAPAMIGANSGLISLVKQKSSNSRNTLHDSQNGACFKNHSEETSRTYVCGN